MRSEDLNKKCDELIESHNVNERDAKYCRIFFNACADILLPEIDIFKAEVSHQGRQSVKFTDKITQLEKQVQAVSEQRDSVVKENAELRKQISNSSDVVEKLWTEKVQTTNKLTAQLAIATEALEVIRDTGSRISPTYAAQALATIKDVK